MYAEVADGKPTSGTLELLTKARSLGASTVAAIVGSDAGDAAGGARRPRRADRLRHRRSRREAPGVAVAAAMKALIDTGSAPDLLLFPMTYGARDVAARLSVKLDRTVTTNNVDIAVAGDAVTVTTAIFGGNTLVTTTYTGPGPYLAGFRPKSFAAEESGGAPAAVEAAPVPDLGATGAATVKAVHVEESSGPKLDEANIVVSGGRGLGEAGKYEMIEQLAKLLKGAPGASRAIVDAGWVPYSYQVGQTGKVVKPTVYIACGISGATQHMVGMKGSKNIIAINKDKEAPSSRLPTSASSVTCTRCCPSSSRR